MFFDPNLTSYSSLFFQIFPNDLSLSVCCSHFLQKCLLAAVTLTDTALAMVMVGERDATATLAATGILIYFISPFTYIIAVTFVPNDKTFVLRTRISTLLTQE